MSLLFTPKNIGNIEIKNRFVHSATGEAMAGPEGEVTDRLIKRYRSLARGEVGLIIPGTAYIHPFRKGFPILTIHNDDMIKGLQKLVKTIHDEQGNVFFQLSHVGSQSTKEMLGYRAMGPSSKWDPVNMIKPKQMTEKDIIEVINMFAMAAKRTVETGADGIQLHAANGFLINQFLSPFINLRKDKWGGSDENRFRFLKEIITKIKSTIGDEFPIIIKLNTNEYVSEKGITPNLAKKYCRWLTDLGINGIEIASGLGNHGLSFINICRGEVPVAEFLKSIPLWKKPLGWIMLKSIIGKYNFVEGYNLETAKIIKPVIKDVPLILVGGMRSVSFMEQLLKNDELDFISMSRPLIREPNLVKNFKSGNRESARCTSCNKCWGNTIGNGMPLRCYQLG